MGDLRILATFSAGSSGKYIVKKDSKLCEDTVVICDFFCVHLWENLWQAT